MANIEAYLRAVEIHQLLKQNQIVNSTLVSQRFELSARQSQRILDFLRERLGAPLAYDHKRHTFYYTEAAFELPAALMSESEAVGLIVAHQALLEGQDTPFSGSLGNALDKLRAFMPRTVSVTASDLLDHVSVTGHPQRRVDPTVVAAVSRALEARRSVSLEHYAPHRNETTRRQLDLYHLKRFRGDWYAVGYCHLRQTVRTFALSRVRLVQEEPAAYEVPESFDAEAFFGGSMGIEAGGQIQDVVVDFDAYQARWVREYLWHGSQVLEDLPDGRLRVRMQVALSTELRQWILGYGCHAQVAAPAELVTLIREELRAALALY